jgi:type I restriction enzyme S subunit
VTQTRTIGDLITDRAVIAIQDGNHGELHPKASEYVGIGIPFIMASDLRNGTLNLKECKRLPKARTDSLRIGFAKAGDVLLTHKGTVGEVAIVPDIDNYVMLTPQVTYYRVDDEFLDRRFLKMAFQSPLFRSQLNNMSAQSTRPYIGILARQLSIPWFPIEIQRRIASILGAYDDLIEINRHRIAVLAEIRRLIFDEWFVDLHFPGHEKVRSSASEFGPIPDGWRRSELRDVANVNRRSVKPNTAPTTIQYVDITSVSPDSIDEATEIAFSDAPGRARRQVTDGSIIWSTVRPNRRSHALVLDPPSDMIVSTGFAVLDATAVPFSFLYEAVTTDNFVGYLTNHATGSAYPAVTGETFERAMLLIPSKRLLDVFHQHTEPQLRLADNLRRANGRLAAARDLLLPRLISGELPIAAAEREIEQAA